jgi:hypothetical protein
MDEICLRWGLRRDSVRLAWNGRRLMLFCGVEGIEQEGLEIEAVTIGDAMKVLQSLVLHQLRPECAQ